jgi:hypothetical protein
LPNEQFAFQVATVTVAVLLSSVFVAEVMFLPFHVLVLQGLPLSIVLVAAMYIWLLYVERVEFERDPKVCFGLLCSKCCLTPRVSIN